MRPAKMDLRSLRLDGLRESRAGARGVDLARCTAPTIRGRSAYTVLGFVGYGVASVIAGVLAGLLELPLVDRLIVELGPPLAFLATIWLAKRRAGYERIVFYEATAAAFAVTGVVVVGVGTHVGSVLDVVAAGIGYFLAFGRLGCFRVACCHGRPMNRRFGVRYGHAHVAVGFPELWRDRAIVPVQLIEAVASLALATVAIALMFGEAGDGAAAYVVGYSLVRFALERVRGDRDRRYWLGLSEAQRMAVLTAAVAALLHPRTWTLGGTSLVVLAAAAVVAMHRQAAEQLLRASHVHEVGDFHASMPRGHSEVTSAGLSISRHTLPDGRTDFVWSRESGLTEQDARRLASLLAPAAEVVLGRVPNLVHVVLAARLI